MINLHNCDCMEFMRMIPDKFYDLAIVDPPYGIRITSGGRIRKYNSKNTSWDNETPNDCYFENLFRISKNQIIWGGNYFLDFLTSTKCFIIWDKQQPQDISFASCEFAWSSFNTVAKTFYYSPNRDKERFHPTQKPVSLYKWILTNYAKKGDKIFDSHGGSMSSALACHDLGFDLDICELDEHYFNLAKERLERHQMQQTFDFKEI